MSDTKHYLYRIQPKHPSMLADGLTPHEIETMAKHFAYLQQLMHDGILILARRTLNTDEDSMGIAVINANSEEDARAIMNNDPAIKLGVMHTKLFPYRVTLISEANAE